MALPGEGITYVQLVIYGLIWGSFLTMLIYRLPRKKSLLTRHSFCIHCRTGLKFRDLVPLFSFIHLRGRCRYCGEKISLSYPIVELLTVSLFIFCYRYFGFTLLFYKYILIFTLLLAISCIDLEKGVIPNQLVLILLCWSLIWQFLYPVINIKMASICLLVGGLLFYIIAVLSKGGMGGGDIKLMALLGFSIGFPTVLVNFFLAFLLGAIVGVVMLILGKKTGKDSLPFGPFLCLAYFISIFWGERLWYFYSLYK